MSRPVGRVVTVTPNPAVDVTYRVPRVDVGETHRVSRVVRRPGGKGVNVARVLHALGEEAVVIAPLGGSTGDFVARSVAAEGISVTAVPIAGVTRETVTVVDDGGSTVFNEPGPEVSAGEWDALLAAVGAELAGASVLVVSGSSPAGAPVDLQARFVRLGAGAGVPVVVDTSGPAPVEAAGAGLALVKPNAEELRAATGEADLLAGARTLLDRGVGCVVVSLGDEGLLAVTADGASRVAAVPGVTGNPTGAGDATVAGLVRGLAVGRPWPEVLPEAAALGAAAVLAEVAGEVDLSAYHRFVPALRAAPLD